MREPDRKTLIDRLVRWGYLNDPDGVSKSELMRAVRDYQRFHTDPLNVETERFHAREANIDGDVGPATLALMNARTCDATDPIANRATGNLNWPESCRNEITVSWNFVEVPGLNATNTAAVWQNVKKEYESRFVLRLLLSPERYPDTRIYAALKALPGPTLAWSYLAESDCGARLRQAYDNTIRWTMPLAVGTWKHEVGHALGMEHTPGDPESLMYPSMNGQTGLNETDIQQMQDIGYKLRPQDPSPDPDPLPPGKKVSVAVFVDGNTYHHEWDSSEAVETPNFKPF